MDSLHIVRIAEQFPPSKGGLAPAMLALSLEQHRQGHHVTIVTPDSAEAHLTDDRLPFTVIRVPSRSLLHLGWLAYDVLRDLPARPDVVHCHGPAAAAILCRRSKSDFPVVLTLHAVRKFQFICLRDINQSVTAFERATGLKVRHRPRNYHPLSVQYIKELLIERFICSNADHLVLVSKCFQEQLATYYRIPSHKCTVVYNGSDMMLPISECKTAQGSSPASREGEVILYVGRVDWGKRAHLLVQAMPEVLSSNPDAKLLLVGDGDQRGDLEALVRQMGLCERISFAGWVRHDELAALYASARCLCLPSASEGLSKVLLEAMGLGTPVIASDIPANRELMQQGRLGMLVAPANPTAWAAAIKQLLSNATDADARAREAARAVVDRYLWAHVAKRLDHAYGALVPGFTPARPV